MALATREKRSRHHKKAIGRHHRQDGRYLKTYWPYLPMLLIVGMGIVVNSIWSGQGVLGVSSDYNAAALLSQTNAQRAGQNEKALIINPQLHAAAQAKADDMAKNNYWSHNSPDGKTPWSFINASGYNYQVAGENLAYGFNNAADTVAGWMNSPTHKANILNANYQDVGFGVANSPNYQGQGPETIIVAEYGAPAGAVLSEPSGTAGAQDLTGKTRPVSRIQLLTGGHATWSTALVSALAGAAIALFLVRYGLHVKRLVAEGESFVLNHPMLDITLVFIGTMAVIFAQAGGTIR